ncbi:hypothetical protein PV11_09201 [Exophiala sideris]|uniref:HIT-type domain-containing protein n=1 Tax=Exophiala sideris TaxID=1016849 RepID=A0A0D1Y9D1_9EURO|nr:hypothetical protein PV11_09201 [Exophiala sideris]
MSTKTCSVCGGSSFKYHCSSCRATSCSLQCYKAHQGQCARLVGGDDSKPSTATTTATSSDTLKSLPLTETLTQDRRLQELFQKYPMLRPKLKLIFETAVQKDPDIDSAAHARYHRTPKSPEQRLTWALRRLEHEMSSENAERIGLKAFGELVGQLSPQQGAGE